MDRSHREQVEEWRYQEFLAYKRHEIVGPLGQRTVQALFAPLGIAVSRFETVMPVERPIKNELLAEKLAQPMAAVSIREFMQHDQPQPDLHGEQVYMGYANRSDHVLAA